MKKKKSLLLACFSIYIFNFVVFNLSNIIYVRPEMKIIYSLSLYIFSTIAVLEIIITKRSLKEYTLIYIIFLPLLISAIKTGYQSFFLLFLSIVSLKNVNKDLVIKILFFSELMGTIFVMLLNLLGVIPSKIMGSPWGGNRNSLGFLHPNSLALVVFSIMILCYVLYWDNFKVYMKIIYFSFFLLLYYFSRSRTLLLFPSLFIINNWIKYHPTFFEKRIIIKSILLLFIGVSLLSVYAAIIYPDKMWSVTLNEVLSDRISMGAAFFEYQGIHLLGNKFDDSSVPFLSTIFQTTMKPVLDNAYMRMLFTGGILVFIIGLFLYSKLLLLLFNQKNTKVLVAAILFYLIGISDNSFYLLPINFSWLFLFFNPDEERKQVPIEQYQKKFNL